MQEIQYLSNNQIDKLKWDKTIKLSVNKHIYALSWYLDIVSPNWGALVEGDYIAVMPLTTKKKAFVNYIIQPILCQQLGVYSNDTSKISNIDYFLQQIPTHFKYSIIHLNNSNYSEIFKDKLKARTNHVLDISKSFKDLSKNFSRRTIRNIKNATDAGLTLTESMTPKDFTIFKTENAQPVLKKNAKNVLEQLCQFTIDNKTGKIIVANNPLGDIVAAAFYYWFENTIYLSVTVSNNEGKEKSAMHLLVESIIREYAEKDYKLDFTGSSLKGVAYFNEGFGAVPTIYYSYENNKLPFFLKILKRK